MLDPERASHYHLGRDFSMTQWQWASHHNNNVMLIGAPGSGKTRYNIIPNIRQRYGSYIIIDPKGALYGQTADELAAYGYDVKRLDLEEMESDCTYDPFFMAESEADLRAVCHELVYANGIDRSDPFWNQETEGVLYALALKSCETSKDGHAHFAQMMGFLDVAYDHDENRTTRSAYMTEGNDLLSKLDALMMPDAISSDTEEGRKLLEASKRLLHCVNEYRIALDNLKTVPHFSFERNSDAGLSQAVFDDEGFFSYRIHMYSEKEGHSFASTDPGESRVHYIPGLNGKAILAYADPSELRANAYDVTRDLDPNDTSRLKHIDGFGLQFSDADMESIRRLDLEAQERLLGIARGNAIKAAERSVGIGSCEKLPELSDYLFRRKEDELLFMAVQECHGKIQETARKLSAEIKACKKARESLPSYRFWKRMRGAANRTWLSALASVNADVNPYMVPQMANMLGNPALPQLDFKAAGRHECAYYIVISDSDRSRDSFVRIMMQQAVNALERAANQEKHNALTVPVRFFVDDFPAIGRLHGIESWLNTTRSREISWTLAIQGIGQLEYVYSYAGAQALMAACDIQIYVGAPNDYSTAQMLGKRIEGDPYLQPLDKQWVFIRGERPRLVEFCDPDRVPDQEDPEL